MANLTTADAMKKWDKVTAEMWIDVTPSEIRITSLFDEIVFADQGLTYRSHVPNRSGPLGEVFEEMCRRYAASPRPGPERTPARTTGCTRLMQGPPSSERQRPEPVHHADV